MNENRTGFWSSWVPHIVMANLVLVALIFLGSPQCSGAKAEEQSPWPALEELRRQSMQLRKRIERLESLPTNHKEEIERRVQEQR